MRKVLSYILIAICILSAVIIPVGQYFIFTKENYISIFGYYFVCSSAILVFSQIRINYQISKRKSGFDFIQGKMTTELVPIYTDLRKILNSDLMPILKGKSLSKLLDDNAINDDDKKN